MRSDIVLNLDVEVEMKDLCGGGADDKGATWKISAKQPALSKDAAHLMDGFRRAERRTIKTRDRGYEPTVRPAMPTGPGDRYYDMRVANTKTATSALARELKGRHLQMIAFGGAIAVADGPMGTGLFVVSGSSLYKGGPASVLCSYLFIGALQYCTMQSLCELCIIFPIAGSFSAFSTRFLDPSWGFAMGWNYCFQWLLALPLELIAAAYTITYWNEHLNKAIFITIFLLAILAINLVGIKAYGEAEFIFSIIKITAVIGFILLAIVINIGGRPESGYIGSQYWRNPGPFNNGLKGFSSCLVTSAFSFAGTELIGLAAAETANPRKSFPAAIKQVFWRIAIFYIVAILLVGLLIPSNEPRLINGKNNADASASPFVIAIESAGTTILSSVMNAVILIAVISVGNSAVFGSSRTLAALAEQSHAPQIFAYVDKQGRPLMAILFAALVGMMAYLAELKVYDNILHWLISISTLSTVFTWASISLCHIRFRKAWAYASYPLEKLPFRSSVGVIGSWFAFVGYVLVLLSQIWLAISPIETPGLDTSPSGRVKIFFLRAMTIPIVLICYISHKIWLRTRVIRAHEMDVDTGRRHYRVHIINEQERDERRGWPLWKKIYRTLC